MLRTISSAAFRRLSYRPLILPTDNGTRCLSLGPSRCVADLSNISQNLPTSATQPKAIASTPFHIIRHTSSASGTSGDNKTELTPNDRIDNMIKNSKKRVFLFMKGNPEQPQCGYSSAVVQILNAYGVEYDSFDVLSDEEIRKEIKNYSNWPTIPQVYVDKSFVGGCDILIQMHQNDELEKLLSPA